MPRPCSVPAASAAAAAGGCCWRNDHKPPTLLSSPLTRASEVRSGEHGWWLPLLPPGALLLPCERWGSKGCRCRVPASSALMWTDSIGSGSCTSCRLMLPPVLLPMLLLSLLPGLLVVLGCGGGAGAAAEEPLYAGSRLMSVQQLAHLQARQGQSAHMFSI